MRKTPVLLLACFALTLHAQTSPASPDAPPAPSQASAAGSSDAGVAKARAALDAMVKALGGDRWLNVQNVYVTGRIASFYQGKPTGGTIQFWEWKTPDKERLDLDEKSHDRHRWVQLFEPTQCREITFKGIEPMKAPSGPDPCQSAMRSRDHSIEAAVKVWMKDPKTILMWEGQTLAERHLTDQVTLINDQNDSITIQMDADTHLPLARTWYWRDPEYKDRNEEAEDYADYHTVDGLPMPFTISRLHNGDMIQERYIFKGGYNIQLPAELFDAQAILAKIPK
ncbi:MAG TPA: hypothetical protein VKT75_03205 [Acidobacteriaceae bacterium]|nr:hypothetical protein [Acidobacteriaceae bacterium]